MTNSTFPEGYSTNGDLHYAPYNNDPRISHAHGWATGPTSVLTYYAAGLQILTASGKTWSVSPSLKGLETAEAGYSTNLGTFSSNVTSSENTLRVRFSTPANTTGSLSLEYPARADTLTISGRPCGNLMLQIPAGGKGRLELGGLGGWIVRTNFVMH